MGFKFSSDLKNHLRNSLCGMEGGRKGFSKGRSATNVNKFCTHWLGGRCLAAR